MMDETHRDTFPEPIFASRVLRARSLIAATVSALFVRADEKLTAFVELESAVRDQFNLNDSANGILN